MRMSNLESFVSGGTEGRQACNDWKALRRLRTRLRSRSAFFAVGMAAAPVGHLFLLLPVDGLIIYSQKQEPQTSAKQKKTKVGLSEGASIAFLLLYTSQTSSFKVPFAPLGTSLYYHHHYNHHYLWSSLIITVQVDVTRHLLKRTLAYSNSLIVSLWQVVVWHTCC